MSRSACAPCGLHRESCAAKSFELLKQTVEVPLPWGVAQLDVDVDGCDLAKRSVGENTDL